MKHSLLAKSLCTLALGTALFTAAQAQPMPDGPMDHPAHAAQWHEHMMKHWQEHQKVLHDKLKLSAEQETAWQTFKQSVKPPETPMHDRPQFDPAKREELASLTTPQRLQKMNLWQEERFKTMQEHMKQHQQAVLAFYSQLTPDQQKIFDDETLPKWKPHPEGKKPQAK